MPSSQAPAELRNVLEQHIKHLPGPKGDLENEPYVERMMDKCDGIAIFTYEGKLLYGWSQDKMNAWYWHADYNESDCSSSCSYEYVQSDGSKITIPSESKIVSDFIAGTVDHLFFNGCKFALAQRDVWDDGITFSVLSGKEGRGLLCAVSPDKYYLLIVSASPNAFPTEHYFGIDSNRSQGMVKRGLRELGIEFHQFAPSALGI